MKKCKRCGRRTEDLDDRGMCYYYHPRIRDTRILKTALLPVLGDIFCRNSEIPAGWGLKIASGDRRYYYTSDLESLQTRCRLELVRQSTSLTAVRRALRWKI